jgi:hypothetical protein
MSTQQGIRNDLCIHNLSMPNIIVWELIQHRARQIFL